jgi:hypothetical protein
MPSYYTTSEGYAYVIPHHLDYAQCPKKQTHDGVSKSFRTGRLERELQMVQLSATKCSCIAIL